MRIAIYFLLASVLAVGTTGIAENSSYQYGQVIEDLRGVGGGVTVTWKTSTEEYSGNYVDAGNLLNLFVNTRLENLGKAYGELLKNLDVEHNPNIKSNKLRFLDYLGSSGWEIVWVRELEAKTIYEFKRPIVE